MSTRNSYRGLESKLIKMVKHKARKAVGNAGIREHDIPDIEQDLMLTLLKGLKRYDSAKSKRTTYASVLLNTRMNWIYRFRLSRSRRASCNWSSLNLQVKIGESEFNELIDLVNNDGLLEEESLASFGLWEDENLRIDIEPVIKQMPVKLQKICECLKIKNVTETARELKLSRTTIYRKLQEIRHLFIRHGLEAYLSR